MTEKEFLATLATKAVRKKLKFSHSIVWTLKLAEERNNCSIEKSIGIRTAGGWCPVDVVVGELGGYADQKLCKQHGLSSALVAKIIQASDGVEIPLRTKILKAVGL